MTNLLALEHSAWAVNQLDQALIELSLKEDLGYPYHDLTSELLSFDQKPQQANVIVKQPEPIILSGLVLLPEIINRLSLPCEIHSQYRDGDRVKSGDMVLTLIGMPQVLLMLERTLLNFLQRLSGIATLTARFVDRVKHTQMSILDTRKTTPGIRHLEKYAVFCGGGVNHRMGLYDAVMIKDTHIDLAGGISRVLAKLPVITPKHPLTIIEVRDIAELKILLAEGVTKVHRVLLDNMTPSQLRESVTLCRGQVVTEASGNITLDSIGEIAETGVNFASVGCLTHSAPVVDLSMKISHAGCRRQAAARR